MSRVLLVPAVAVGVLLGSLGVLATPGVLVPGVLLGGFAGVLVAGRERLPATGAVPLPAVAGRRAGVLTAAAIPAAFLVVAGTGVLLGAAGATVILLLLVGTALLARWWLRREPGAVLGPVTGTGARRPVPPGPPGTAAALSTAHLCRAWQHSYSALLDHPAGSARRDIVAFREELLDELERRDPAGFTRWLQADGRAGGDPGRHLGAAGRPAHRAGHDGAPAEEERWSDE